VLAILCAIKVKGAFDVAIKVKGAFDVK
jgi:hypothetical protein